MPNRATTIRVMSALAVHASCQPIDCLVACHFDPDRQQLLSDAIGQSTNIRCKIKLKDD